MSGTYVPPSRRNAASSNKTSVPLTNEYFPQLSTRTPTILPTKSGISFSALASEWNEKDEEDAVERTIQEDSARNYAERADADKRTFVPLRRDYNNPEPYIYSAEDEDTSGLVPTPADDDGWKTVEKKKKKEWTLEEQIERKQLYEEEQAKKEAEVSVWTSGEHRSDDWSHRDRRTL